MPASFSRQVAPGPGSLVYSEGFAFEEQGELPGGDGRGRGLLGKGEQHPQASALEAANDQVEPDAVAEQSPELGLVALDEEHAVAVVRLGTEAIGLGEKAIEAFPEVHPVLCQEYPADRYGKHGRQPRVASGSSASRTLTDHGPRRSSSP